LGGSGGAVEAPLPETKREDFWYAPRRVSDWQRNLVADDARLGQILRECRRIAVLGIKTEAQRDRPAFYVPEYMDRAGYDIVPVPVYYPEVTTILGRPVYRSLLSISPPVDMVNIFRRPPDIPPHVPDILAARPRVVWFQLGIRHDAAAERLARAGIEVVQDRCVLVEHRRRL
jgi:predicted CoA-binding protein